MKNERRTPAGQARFGAALRLLRVGKGEGLRALARKLGMSATYLSRVEAGIDPPPAPERLADIAAALGVPEDLMSGLAGRVAPDLLEYLVSQPAAMALLRVLVETDPPSDLLVEITRQLRSKLSGAAPAQKLPAAFEHVLAVDAGHEEPLARVATEVGRHHEIDRKALVAELADRGLVSDMSVGNRVAIAHACVEALPFSRVVVLRARRGFQGRGRRTRYVFCLLFPAAEADERVTVLGALARLALDGDVTTALDRTSAGSLATVFLREAKRILATETHPRRPRRRAS